MDCRIYVLLCFVAATSAWSIPFYPVQAIRHTRHVHPPPHFRIPPAPYRDTGPGPVPVREAPETDERQRPKRDHDFESFDHDHRDRDHDRRTSGITGPIHTFVKTDKNANYKWGVRHHVGNKYAP